MDQAVHHSGLDVVAAAGTPTPVQDPFPRPPLVHEPMVVGGDRGRDVRLAFDTALRNLIRTDLAKQSKLEKKDPAEIQTRFHLSGPVARSLFFDSSRASTTEIDGVIRRSFARGLFEFATSQEGTDQEASYRMYLVRPQESWDEDGVLRLVRAEPSYILSPATSPPALWS
jgi:hypothetical protein